MVNGLNPFQYLRQDELWVLPARNRGAPGPDPGMDGRAGNTDVVVPELLDEILLREDQEFPPSSAEQGIPTTWSPCPPIIEFIKNSFEFKLPDASFAINSIAFEFAAIA